LSAVWEPSSIVVAAFSSHGRVDWSRRAGCPCQTGRSRRRSRPLRETLYSVLHTLHATVAAEPQPPEQVRRPPSPSDDNRAVRTKCGMCDQTVKATYLYEHQRRRHKKKKERVYTERRKWCDRCQKDHSRSNYTRWGCRKKPEVPKGAEAIS
jgi:hypothetical protein